MSDVKFVFRVWSADRKQRKAIVHSTFCVKDVIRKAGEKLGVPPADTKKLVLEHDGTEVDDDDVLEVFKEDTLLLLRKNEEWRQEDCAAAKNAATSDGASRDGEIVDHEPAIVNKDIQPRITSGTLRDQLVQPNTSLLNLAPSSSQSHKITLSRFISLKPLRAEHQPIASKSYSASSGRGTKRPAAAAAAASELPTTQPKRTPCNSTEPSARSDALELVHEFPQTDGQRVLGVAHLNGKMYFIDSMSNTIRIHDDTAPYDSSSFQVPGLSSPRDIAAASLPTLCLFIMGVGVDKRKTVWKVKLQNGKVCQQQIGKLIQLDSTAGTLSVSSSGWLLSTDFMHNHVKVYGPLGSYHKKIDLHQFKGLLHTVRLQPTREASLLVCHGIADTKHRVCILTSSGKKIKNSFGDKPGSRDDQVNNPSHVTVQYGEDRNGVKCCRRVFVADELNDRVLVLDDKLALVTKIPDLDKPHRLCYIDEKQLLVVACNQKVKLFKCH